MYIDDEIDRIIEDNISQLIDKLKKEGFDVEYSDIEYSFMNREEYVRILSDKLYPEEWLPKQFGVYRGYAGGGIHSSLIRTELDNLNKKRINKATRILDYFKECYENILNGLNLRVG